jgi:hypothetical protein
MQATQLGMKPLADHIPVSHDDSSDERIRADSTPPALSKLQRPREMPLIRGCELAIHATD